MPGRGGATVLDDLPESIVVEEILVRLPPKDLLRCRAVRKCWHSATSTHKFMLDHYRRQPVLPVLSHVGNPQDRRLFIYGDYAGAGQQRLCPVIRTYGDGGVEAVLDGLLVVSHGSVPQTETEFFVCNPATRKCAPLEKPQSRKGDPFHYIAGFYRHQPSGECRVLWVSKPTIYDAYDTDYRTFYIVIAVGCNDTRCILKASVPPPEVSPPSLELVLRVGVPCSSFRQPVHHRGSLHWKLEKYHRCDDGNIVVFNTVAETFRLMCRPAQLRPAGDVWLLEMDGTLALCSISSDKNTIDVWGIQDYDAETWSFKHRINLSGVDPVYSNVPGFPRMAVVLYEHELLIQFASMRVLRYDMDGKFLGYVKSEEGQDINLWITEHYLQQSVIPLPLFHETREEAEPPFFVGL